MVKGPLTREQEWEINRKGVRQRNVVKAQKVGKLVKNRLVKSKGIENKFLHLFNFNSNTLL